MTLVSERIGQFFHDGHRLEYTEYGGGDRWVVLIHGQLMPRRMHQPLARHLAAAGAHVLTVDLLGHGRSDRPDDPLLYSMTAFAEQVVALLDDREIPSAVIGGTSLGANVSLEVARTRARPRPRPVAEMPVLDNALEAGDPGVRSAAASSPASCRSRSPVCAGRHPVWSLAGSCRSGSASGWTPLDQRPARWRRAIHGIFFGRVAPSVPLAQADRGAGPGGRPPARPHPPGGRRRDAGRGAAGLAIRRGPTTILEWRVRPRRLDELTAEFVARRASSATPPPAVGCRSEGSAGPRARLAPIRSEARRVPLICEHGARD